MQSGQYVKFLKVEDKDPRRIAASYYYYPRQL